MCALWSRACELRVASRSPASHLLPHMWRTEICAVGGSWSRITLLSLVILRKNRRFCGSAGAGAAWGGGWGGLCSTDNRRSAAQWPALTSTNVWSTARKNLGPCWAVCATCPISLLRGCIALSSREIHEIAGASGRPVQTRTTQCEVRRGSPASRRIWGMSWRDLLVCGHGGTRCTMRSACILRKNRRFCGSAGVGVAWGGGWGGLRST
jgi:hypothetical protein